MAETLINKLTTQWTEEKVQMLKQLIADCQSATQIGLRLGVTRNAVIGKVRRMGLRLLGRPNAPTSTKRARPRLIIYNTYAALKPEYEMSKKDSKPEELPTSKPCSILDLTTDTCRWPLWDAHDTENKLYCGAPISGKTYCATHKAMTKVIYRRSTETPRPFLLSSRPR